MELRGKTGVRKRPMTARELAGTDDDQKSGSRLFQRSCLRGTSPWAVALKEALRAPCGSTMFPHARSKHDAATYFWRERQQAAVDEGRASRVC